MRNDTRPKTVLLHVGPVETFVPRDRIGSFQPWTIKKGRPRCRRPLSPRSRTTPSAACPGGRVRPGSPTIARRAGSARTTDPGTIEGRSRMSP
ncbi:hypothetical protein D9753_04790 [Streptomyces dangxiongensis]|uniref:Uncharacterized protein n=1 Tax=Streptomyces dangxiongensis TaxID=1442032 RepID=A0A3G2JCU6_9ACTN|nr:hypothetical protein D9753_04790 [Streptomyces dangxiongensis]